MAGSKIFSGTAFKWAGSSFRAPATTPAPMPPKDTKLVPDKPAPPALAKPTKPEPTLSLPYASDAEAALLACFLCTQPGGLVGLSSEVRADIVMRASRFILGGLALAAEQPMDPGANVFRKMFAEMPEETRLRAAECMYDGSFMVTAFALATQNNKSVS